MYRMMMEHLTDSWELIFTINRSGRNSISGRTCASI
jgi:hypothetical protein